MRRKLSKLFNIGIHNSFVSLLQKRRLAIQASYQIYFKRNFCDDFFTFTHLMCCCYAMVKRKELELRNFEGGWRNECDPRKLFFVRSLRVADNSTLTCRLPRKKDGSSTIPIHDALGAS